MENRQPEELIERKDQDETFEEAVARKGHSSNPKHMCSFQSSLKEVLTLMEEGDDTVQQQESQALMLHNGGEKQDVEEVGKTAEWGKTGNGYECGIVEQNGLEKQGSAKDTSITIITGKGLMHGEEESTRCHYDFFPKGIEERFLVNSLQAGGNAEALPQLKPPESDCKPSNQTEVMEQEDPFAPKRMLQPSFINCLDLSLKLSHPLNAFGEFDCCVKEGNRSENYVNNKKWKPSLNLSRFVSRPCSILLSAGSGELAEIGDCKLQASISNKKRLGGCDGMGGENAPISVSSEGTKGSGDRPMWAYPPNDPTASAHFLSAFPGSISLDLVQSFGLEPDSDVQTTENCVSDRRNLLGLGTECSECGPNLTKSAEIESMSEAEELKKLREEERALAAAPSLSKNPGYGALDLLVTAIQVTSGYLLGEDDNDLPECFQEEDDKKGLGDSELSVEANFLYGKSPVVRKRVLRRARSAFKKPIVEESVVEVAGALSSPNRGRKRATLDEEQVEDDEIKVNLSVIGAQSAINEELPVMRSKRGRFQILPTKFYDSVLQSWKRKSRRKQKVKL